MDDSPDDAKLLLRAIEKAGFSPSSERVETAAAMSAALDRGGWEIVVCDYAMPRFSAPKAFELLRAKGIDIPFIIVSGTVNEETAVEAMRLGVSDYINKDKLARLAPAIEREVKEHKSRANSERQLALAHERYRHLFESSPLPMWVYDKKTLAFLEVNDAAVQHYGYTRAEFATMTLADIRPASDVAALHDDIEQNLPSAFGRRWRHRKKDGAIIDVEIRAHDLEFGDQTTRLVLVNDVTQRLAAERALRQTEEQLRQAQKMEAVGRLAGGVAHDFNNLLSVVLSYTGLLLDELEPGSPMREDLEEVKKAGERAADLTRQLLMFSRQHAVNLQVLDLNGVLVGMEKILRRTLGADVELVTRQGKNLSMVKADQGHLEQVLMNLAVNARDAMPKGGKLTIETSNVELDEIYAAKHHGTQAGPHVMLAVSDNGVGMDRETQTRIFEPFFTTKEPGKGTGLGLSTVFGIVQQVGGSIWVYSEPGKGTTFKVFLPSASEVSDERPTTHKPAARGGAETILLVEDEDAVRAVARGILRRRGYNVLEASNAEDAARACEGDAKIHLLLTDVILPRTSGVEIAKRARDLRPGIKVLFMSGYTGEAIVSHGMLESGVAFLQKPLTPELLAAKVRQVLDE